jgi:MFS family permease
MKPIASHSRTLWLTGVAHAFTHLYQVALVPLYLRIQQDLGLGSVEGATLLVTIMGVAYFLPSYPMGWLADRVNRRRLLAVGLAINGLGFVGLAWSPNYGCALACALVAGFGGSFYHPAATALVARLCPVGTGRAFGLVGIGASVGFFVGPIYSGWRAVSTGNWRVPILELGILGVVAAMMVFHFAEDEPGAGVPAKEAKPERMFATPALWMMFVVAAVAFSLRDFAGAGNGSLTSLFLQKAHGFNPREAGMALSAVFIASAISNPLFGGMSDRGRMRWLCAVLLISACLLLVFPHLGPEWSVPVLAIYGFFFMSSFPMTEAALMESVHDSVRGRVFGLFITISGLLSNQAHWAAGHWVKELGAEASVPARYHGLYATLAAWMAVSVIGAACLRGIRKRDAAGSGSADASSPA